MKQCPFCAESVQPDAKKCRYCGEYIDPVLAKSLAQQPNQPIVINNNNNNNNNNRNADLFAYNARSDMQQGTIIGLFIGMVLIGCFLFLVAVVAGGCESPPLRQAEIRMPEPIIVPQLTPEQAAAAQKLLIEKWVVGSAIVAIFGTWIWYLKVSQTPALDTYVVDVEYLTEDESC